MLRGGLLDIRFFLSKFETLGNLNAFGKNVVNFITQHALDELFLNERHTLLVIVHWADELSL